MEHIKDTINKLNCLHQKKADSLATLQVGLKWFLTMFPNVNWCHEDIRGGNERPVVILATEDPVSIDEKELKNSFKSHTSYSDFKENLFTIGTLINHQGKRYFYIQCMNDMIGVRGGKQTIYRRMNNELFPHVESYYKK